MDEGIPETGKSTLAAFVTASVSKAGQRVAFFSGEDDAAAIVVPRLIAAGAQMDQVFVRGPDVDEELLLPRDMEKLFQYVYENEIRLVVLDTIDHFTSGNLNVKRFTSDLMKKLGALARDSGSTVLLTRHLRKGGGRASERGMGSAGILAGSRFAFIVAAPPGAAPGTRVVAACTKMTMARRPASRAYGFVDTAAGTASLEYQGVTLLSAEDLLAAPDRTDTRVGRVRERAIDYLRKTLADGPRPVRDVESHRPTDVSARTLERARTELGVESRRIGTTWFMALPDEDDELPGLSDFDEPEHVTVDPAAH